MSENPPEGFEITVERDMNSVTYGWSTLGTGSQRKMIKVLTSFIAISCGCVLAGIIGVLIFRKPVQPILYAISVMFSLTWLQTLWGMRIAFTGGRPERVVLGEDCFVYEPGGSRMTYSLAVWGTLTRTSSPIELYGRIFRSLKPVTFAEGTIPKFVLDRSSVRQRLYFARGADRIDVGELLR